MDNLLRARYPRFTRLDLRLNWRPRGTASRWLFYLELRALGGALFGDRRYGRVFIYHNGAQSYYAARGFRGLLLV